MDTNNQLYLGNIYLDLSNLPLGGGEEQKGFFSK